MDDSSSAYEDNVLKAIEKGGVTRSVEEAIMRQYWANRGIRKYASDRIEMEVSGGIQWTIEANQDCQSVGFSVALASKHLINHLLRAESCRVIMSKAWLKIRIIISLIGFIKLQRKAISLQLTHQ